jgi:hypothetical protein
MRKWVSGIGVLVVAAMAYGQEFEGVPGKVVLYNTTTRDIEVGIAEGGVGDLSLRAKGRLVHKFCGEKNEPFGIALHYFGDPPDKFMGKLSVCDGDVYAVTPEGIKTIKTVERPKKPEGEPDFTKPDEVIASLEKMKKEAQEKKAYTAMGKCNFAINVIKNLVEQKLAEPSTLKQRWQEANEEYQKIPK